MKYVLISILTLVSLVASAETTISFSNDALELLNVVSHCPKEFAEISSKGSAYGATLGGDEVTTNYNVAFYAGGYAPTFAHYPVGALEITKTFQSSNIANTPDASGGADVYTCKVVYIR